jgi:hypothetical protein
MKELDNLKTGISKLVTELNKKEARYQTIVDQEGTYKIHSQLSANDLKEIVSFIQDNLEKGNWDALLQQQGGLRVPKNQQGGAPKRTLSIITLPNNEFSILIETKSKLIDKKIADVEPIYKKPHGAVKHGTPCMLLWPRTIDKPNKKWWSGVVDKEAAFEEVKVEANVSMQDNPYIQNAIVGQPYESPKHKDKRLPLYGEIAEEGDFEKFLEKENPSRKTIDNIVYSFLLGIEHLHEQNILHRDIKPANIIVAKDDHGKHYGKAMDFGESMKDRTRISGDPNFFSPEAATLFFNKKPDRYSIVCKNAVCDLLYHTEITNNPNPPPFLATEADDVWSIGAMMLSLYSDIGIINKDRVKQLLTDKNAYGQLEKMIAQKGSNEVDKMYYVIVNCLRINPKERFTVNQIVENLPNQTLVKHFRNEIDRTHDKENIPKRKSLVFSEPDASTRKEVKVKNTDVGPPVLNQRRKNTPSTGH